MFQRNFATHPINTAPVAIVVGLLLAALPGSVSAEIIWSGDFETGNFMQWHTQGDRNKVSFFQMPAYGRPVNYPGQQPLDSAHAGTGNLCSLVAPTNRSVNGFDYQSGPVRNGDYAAKFVVENSTAVGGDGVEPQDCDNGNCTRRRTVLTVQQTLPKIYNALPYMTERWLSVSLYVPSDWENDNEGWGPSIYGLKPLTERGDSGLSGMFGIGISGSSWSLLHRWSAVENPTMDDVPWQQQMNYTNDFVGEGGGPYPREDYWPEGLEDYPDIAASQAALGDLNKGGWTDWVVHLKFDARGSSEGGTGFLKVWKRANNGPWVHVLNIVPKQLTRGYTFDRGIGYNSPAGSGHNGGFGIKVGMYMEKAQVWNNSRERVLYVDNVKVGDANSAFSDMSPDGSSPGSMSSNRPLPPSFTP